MASVLHGRRPETGSPSRAISLWLLLCCTLLAALIIVGGVTRLTHSGLSIAEWRPILGTLPPLDDAAWAETFAIYQRTPEYLKVNRGMSLEQFREIFWWEYSHRLLARALGLAYLVPFLAFLLRRRIRGALAWRLGGIFLLGAAQGALGWFMVASGLVDEPRVSHLRLTAHLGLAFAIFAAMLWVALGLLRASAGGEPLSDSRLAPHGVTVVFLVFAQVLSGGLVAGTRAGYMFNTFPLMLGHLFPPGLLQLEPWPSNLLHHPATIQFVHRALATAVLVAVLLFWWRARRSEVGPVRRRTAGLLLAATALQFSLGVATLLLRVPIALAALHQAGAILLFAAALHAAHEFQRHGVESRAGKVDDHFTGQGARHPGPS